MASASGHDVEGMSRWLLGGFVKGPKGEEIWWIIVQPIDNYRLYMVILLYPKFTSFYIHVLNSGEILGPGPFVLLLDVILFQALLQSN